MVARGIRTITGTICRHWNLMMEWLFLLWLGRIKRKSRRRFNIGEGNCLLRTRLMHGYRSRTALTKDGVWWLRMRKRLRYSGRSGYWASSCLRDRSNASRWPTRRGKANYWLAILCCHHSMPRENRTRRRVVSLLRWCLPE